MWVRAVIPIGIFKDEAQMYKFLDDFIKYCDDYRWCETFHFLIENCDKIDDCFELRMECSDRECCRPVPVPTYEVDLNTWLNQWFKLNLLEEFKIKIDTAYMDEIYAFGEDGWEIAKKLFEMTYRVAVHIKTGKAHNQFRETKFIHCFLNQCGYDSLKESAFHSMVAWQMMVKHLREEKKCA